MIKPEVKIIPRVISFTDRKTIEEDGQIKDVLIFIPDCCRLGLDSCKHVIQKQRKVKNNIGL